MGAPVVPLQRHQTAGDSTGKSQEGFGLPVLSIGGFSTRKKLCVGVITAQLCTSAPERFSDTRVGVWFGCKLTPLHGLSSYCVFEVGVLLHSEEMVTTKVLRWRCCFKVSLYLENSSFSAFPKSEGEIYRLTHGDRCLGKKEKRLEMSLNCLLLHWWRCLPCTHQLGGSAGGGGHQGQNWGLIFFFFFFPPQPWGLS